MLIMLLEKMEAVLTSIGGSNVMTGIKMVNGIKMRAMG